ncbi:MAG TPA: hypothetical protein VFI90_13425 [Rubrobacter sp.]|nr:hypothetical protein [Rubrobacter sp.]
MIRGFRRAFWVMAATLAALGLYLAFAVLGVHTLFYEEVVNEDFAADRSGGAVAVYSGEFHAVAHPGEGHCVPSGG